MKNEEVTSIVSLFGYFLLGLFMLGLGIACLIAANRQYDIAIGFSGVLCAPFGVYVLDSVFSEVRKQIRD